MVEIIESADVAATTEVLGAPAPPVDPPEAPPAVAEPEETAPPPEGALVFHTLPGGGTWTSSEGETYADENIVDNPSAALVRDAGHAHAAGVIEVTQGLDLTGVQSQEDGEAAYAAAVESGDWQIGQDIQAAHEAELRERGEYGLTVEIEGGEGE